jgi:hypothetical protein
MLLVLTQGEAWRGLVLLLALEPRLLFPLLVALLLLLVYT